MIGAVAVYDIFVENLRVYVGVTSRPKLREQAHRTQGNMPYAAELRVVAWYNSRAEALEAERSRIKELKPPLNSVYAERVADRAKVKQRRNEIAIDHWELKAAAAKKIHDDFEAELIAFCGKLKSEGLSVEEIRDRCGWGARLEDVKCWIKGRKAGN
jgi:predicted GIY-YIG superfamily endonuclease